MTIKLELTVEQVNAILQTIGNLPTASGAWPLLVIIKEQAEAQVNAPATPEVLND